MDDSLAIDVRGLTKRYGTRTVVDDVSLQVRSGRICGFLGPNGSGKTTTIRMLCGLLTPDAGEGRCLGLDIRRQAPEIRRQVGYTTQKFGLYEDLSIRENLDFVARLYELPKRREAVDRAIEQLGLAERAGQLASALSGTLGELGVKRIVTCDPHALNSLRNEYPEFGLDCEVVHHTRLIADLLADGRIEVDASLERVIYHDPCYLGRHNGEFDAPRAILARLGIDAPLEFALAREKSMCCGAGGGRMWIDETIGKRINIARVEQALEATPRTIATACPYCAVMVADGLNALRPDGGVQSRDIAELVADAMRTTPSPAPRAVSASTAAAVF